MTIGVPELVLLLLTRMPLVKGVPLMLEGPAGHVALVRATPEKTHHPGAQRWGIGAQL
jgi:hypothetical protein